MRATSASHTGRASDDAEQVGDLIVIGAEYAPHGSAAHAVECSHNVNVRLENIDLFASNCFGFLEYDCDGSTYYRCRIDRRSRRRRPRQTRRSPPALAGRRRLSQQARDQRPGLSRMHRAVSWATTA